MSRSLQILATPQPQRFNFRTFGTNMAIASR
jgi:hypothetical protein